MTNLQNLECAKKSNFHTNSTNQNVESQLKLYFRFKVIDFELPKLHAFKDL